MSDWGINFGTVLSIVVPFVGMVGGAYVMRERLETYIRRVDALEKKLEQLVELFLAQERFEGKLATMDERLSSQGRRIDANGEKLDRHLEFHSTQRIIHDGH